MYLSIARPLVAFNSPACAKPWTLAVIGNRFMQTNLLWTGREYYSLENCLVKVEETGSEITSTIIGSYEGKIYKVEYRIQTNPNWETVFFEINS